MDEIKTSDVIIFQTKEKAVREVVTGRLERMVWTRLVFPNGALGPLTGPHDIEDLVTFGWKKA